jgi:hypothetical protein
MINRGRSLSGFLVSTFPTASDTALGRSLDDVIGRQHGHASFRLLARLGLPGVVVHCVVWKLDF